MSDEMDQPQPDEELELVVPFIVCASKGGPFDDDSFVAGFRCGEIDKALAAARVAGGAATPNAGDCRPVRHRAAAIRCPLVGAHESRLSGWGLSARFDRPGVGGRRGWAARLAMTPLCWCDHPERHDEWTALGHALLAAFYVPQIAAWLNRCLRRWPWLGGGP